MIQVFWGMGKGKTSTLSGMSIRAKGAGLNVLFCKFLKGRKSSEDIVLENIGINMINPATSPKFVFQMNKEEKEQTMKSIYSCIKKIELNADKYDVIVLDEFLDLAANNVSLINEKELTNFIINISKHAEILISGHTKILSIFDIANLITEYKPTKHYFDDGIKARLGFEY